jgi:hypothetical protein
MKKGLRPWFYPEVILGAITGVLFVVTLLNRAWIEIAFSVDPDGGSGLLEWAIVAGLLVATAVLFALARYEWRRASAVAA